MKGTFCEDEIPESHFVTEDIPLFEIEVGRPIEDYEHNFDPTVHLEVEKVYPIGTDVPDEDELDDPEAEVVESVPRTRVAGLNKIWLKAEPSQNEFCNLIYDCFSDGMECLKNFERWSRHQELTPYVNILESWDDKVCDDWDTLDENYLNCDEWLHGNEVYEKQKEWVAEALGHAFQNLDQFYALIEPYLYLHWQNSRINFDLVKEEGLKNATDILPVLLRRFKGQMKQFDNNLPPVKDLGLVRLQFEDIKNALKPVPQQCMNRVKNSLPPVVKQRLELARDWLVKQEARIKGSVLEVEDFVRQ